MKELSKIPTLVTVGAGAAGVWKLRKDRVLGDGGNDRAARPLPAGQLISPGSRLPLQISQL